MKKFLALFLFMAMILVMPVTAFASGNGGGGGNGGGKGDGSGGGNGEALTVESASIEDGASLDAEDSITLVFSKNICHASVREKNMSLAVLKDAAGNEIEIEVLLCDDQIEPEKKNDMIINPVAALAAGDYVLTIKAGVTSKSEVVMDKDYVLKFTVAGEENSAPTDAPTDTPVDSPIEEPSSENDGGNGGLVAAAVAVAAVVVVAIVFTRKKK